MSRRSLFMAAAVVAALAVMIPANPQGLTPGQFTGTFRHWAHIFDGKYPAIVTMNADGTLTATGSTGIQGVWERTGARTVHAMSLLVVHDASGAVVSLERHRCLLEYSLDFNSYQGMEFSESVACPTELSCPDPVDSNTKWTPAPWAPNGFPISGARVKVVAPGPLP